RFGGLRVPHGMVFGPDPDGTLSNNLYIVSTQTNSVMRFGVVPGLPSPITGGNPPGDATFIGTAGGLRDPRALLFRPPGTAPINDILVSSFDSASNRSEVLSFDQATGASNGVFITNGSGGLVEPDGLTLGPDVNNDTFSEVYVSSRATDQVLRYDGRTG